MTCGNSLRIVITLIPTIQHYILYHQHPSSPPAIHLQGSPHGHRTGSERLDMTLDLMLHVVIILFFATILVIAAASLAIVVVSITSVFARSVHACQPVEFGCGDSAAILKLD